MVNIDPENCLTVSEVAELLDMSERGIRQAIIYKRIPAIKGPRQIGTGCSQYYINKKAALLFNYIRKQRAPHDKRIQL